jgi:uncharacterized lipoprotein YmbA
MPLSNQSLPLGIPAFLLTLATVQPGCVNLDPVNDNTKFYIIDPTSEAKEKSSKQDPNHHIYFPKANLPVYLSSSKLTIRQSGTELVFDDAHRWAEPLEDSILRALTNNLCEALPEDWTGSHYPNRRTHAYGYEIQLEIDNFEGRTGNGKEPPSAHFIGSFQIYSQPKYLDSRELKYHQQFKYQTHWPKADPTKLPEALSQLVKQLSTEILNAL